MSIVIHSKDSLVNKDYAQLETRLGCTVPALKPYQMSKETYRMLSKLTYTAAFGDYDEEETIEAENRLFEFASIYIQVNDWDNLMSYCLKATASERIAQVWLYLYKAFESRQKETEEQLCEELDFFCNLHNLPKICAMELLFEDISKDHRVWLQEFVDRWNALFHLSK